MSGEKNKQHQELQIAATASAACFYSNVKHNCYTKRCTYAWSLFKTVAVFLLIPEEEGRKT
jgi:heme-binding NEAT domain protein